MKHSIFFGESLRTFFFGLAFFAFASLFMACVKVQHVAQKDVSYLITGPGHFTAEDSVIESMILPYRMELETEMNVQIGVAETQMLRDAPNNPLGNWMCDAMSFYIRQLGFEFDFAITNPGGVRIPGIEPGPIYRSTIMELMPFDNYLVVLELDGSILAKFLNHTIEFNGWPVSSEVYYSIASDTINTVLINGHPLDINNTYRLLTSDFVANGGDRAFFLQSIDQEETGILMRNALSGYVKIQSEAGNAVKPPLEKRVEFKQ